MRSFTILAARKFFAGAALAAACSIALAGCGRVMTPAELAQHENRAFPGRTRPQVFRATVTALRSEGYELVENDEAVGRVKTAPKVIGAQATGTRYSAVATETSVAWTIDVTVSDRGPIAHAEPRGYVGGQRVDATEMNAGWLERSFAQLYGEIENNLPGRR